MKLNLNGLNLCNHLHTLGFKDNIYHEGNISKLANFNVFFSVLECKRRKSRSHDKRKNGNIKRKICTEKRLNTSLKDLYLALTNHGWHGLFSFLSSLPISVLRNLELEANNLYDRANILYKAALLTRCYVQYFLSPYIDSGVNHKRHFIKIPLINKGIEFIDLHILCTISLAISYVSHLFVRIFVQCQSISIAMKITGSKSNETTEFQTPSFK